MIGPKVTQEYADRRRFNCRSSWFHIACSFLCMSYIGISLGRRACGKERGKWVAHMNCKIRKYHIWKEFQRPSVDRTHESPLQRCSQVKDQGKDRLLVRVSPGQVWWWEEQLCNKRTPRACFPCLFTALSLVCVCVSMYNKICIIHLSLLPPQPNLDSMLHCFNNSFFLLSTFLLYFPSLITCTKKPRQIKTNKLGSSD